MSNAISSNASRSPSRPSLLWVVAAILLVFLAVWPLVGEMTAVNDDQKFIRGDEYTGTLWQNLREGWAHATNFRPLENLAAELCDVQTLDCRRVMILQIAGLAGLVAGIASLMRRVMPEHRAALPLMLIWLALSPATTISLWQMDTSSQTWSSALGVWTGLVACRAIDAIVARRRWWPHILGLTLLSLASVSIKETGYGWSAGIGTAIIVWALWRARSDRASCLRSLCLLVPVALLPMLHLLYRMEFTGLATSLQTGAAGDQARYHVGLGANILNNAWVSLLGLFANGPLHLLFDDAAPLLLKLLPLASLCVAFVLISAAGALALLHRGTAAVRSRAGLLLAVLAGIVSISVTLPMGSVSELYGMGANVASGLLIVAALLALWHPAQKDERPLCRAIALGGALVLLLVGVDGVASRAYHFRLTWQYARALNRMVLDHQRSLPVSTEAARSSSARPTQSVIYFERSCINGPLHNTYVVPPLLAMGFDSTMQWMNRVDPQRRVVFAVEQTMSVHAERDLVIDCSSLPQRQHW